MELYFVPNVIHVPSSIIMQFLITRDFQCNRCPIDQGSCLKHPKPKESGEKLDIDPKPVREVPYNVFLSDSLFFIDRENTSLFNFIESSLIQY